MEKHKLNGKIVGVVGIERDARNFTISKTRNGNDAIMYSHQDFRVVVTVWLNGTGWQILSLASEMTEEKAKLVFPLKEWHNNHLEYFMYWKQAKNISDNSLIILKEK